jgi:hypothetical protein
MPDLDHIRLLADRCRAAADDADEARADLYQAIRDERRRREGRASLRELADAAGLSFNRIAQIEREG